MFTYQDIKNNLTPICERYSHIFDKVILFGSYSRNEQNEFSDIDLYIESSETTGKILKSRAFRDFEYEVADAFPARTEFDFMLFGGNRDLGRVKKSLLYEQIMKDGIVLYDKNAKRV